MAMHDLSSGPIRGHLLRMSAFMLVTMVVQTVYGLIDLFWVGRLGRDAVAAVSLGSNLMMATMAVSQVLAVGATALVSQAMGRKDMPAVAQWFNQALLIAALATLLAMLIGSGAMLWHVVRSPVYLARGAGAWKPQPSLWRRMAGIGLPSGLEMALMTAYMAAVMGLLQRFGSAGQAGFGIGMRVLQAGMMPSMALCFAAGAIVGQNLGAQRPDRVRETFWLCLRYAITTAAVFVVLFHIAPHWLIEPFSADPAVIVAGSDFLRLISWNLIGSAVVFACFGMFSGLGDTRPSLISSAVRIGLILLPATWLAQRDGFAPLWIWYLSVAATAVQAALNLWFLRGRLRHLRSDSGPAVAVA